jgi:uncharacterized DUF497 family protein
MIDFDAIVGFEWDEGSARLSKFKSEIKHGVSQVESEEIFFNEPLLINSDDKHSAQEARYLALGLTNFERSLAVIFTLRKDATLIRVISARDQHRKERHIYEQASR